MTLHTVPFRIGDTAAAPLLSLGEAFETVRAAVLLQLPDAVCVPDLGSHTTGPARRLERFTVVGSSAS